MVPRGTPRRAWYPAEEVLLPGFDASLFQSLSGLLEGLVADLALGGDSVPKTLGEDRKPAGGDRDTRGGHGLQRLHGEVLLRDGRADIG